MVRVSQAPPFWSHLDDRRIIIDKIPGLLLVGSDMLSRAEEQEPCRSLSLPSPVLGQLRDSTACHEAISLWERGFRNRYLLDSWLFIKSYLGLYAGPQCSRFSLRLSVPQRIA